MQQEKEFTFNGQRDNEKVLEVISNHPYILYPSGFRTVLLLVAAMSFFLFLTNTYGIVAGGILVIFASVYFFRAFFIYKESVFLITDQRLVNVGQNGFFSRKIGEVDLDKVIDMSSETEGFSKTFLKYGDLIIRSAGAREGGDMVVKNISNPYLVQQRIANMTKYRGMTGAVSSKQ